MSDGLSNTAGIASWTTYLINHPTRQMPREICFQSGKTGSEFAGREYCRNTTVLQPFREKISDTFSRYSSRITGFSILSGFIELVVACVVVSWFSLI